MGGGGGGNTTTTTAAIDPDIKKRVLPVLSDVTKRYQQEVSGETPVLADDSGVASQIAQQGQLAQQVRDDGLGQAVQTDLQNFAGQQAAAGGLNSARQARANAAGLADRSLQLRQADLDARRQGAQGAVASAEALRGLGQQRIDAPHTSAQRYFGYLQSAPQSQSTKQSGGGGGK